MGVLKRRDNANIVKIIYGGIINIILNEKDDNDRKSLKFLHESLDRWRMVNIQLKN